MHQLQIFLHLDFGSLVSVLNHRCPWDELALGLHGGVAGGFDVWVLHFADGVSGWHRVSRVLAAQDPELPFAATPA